MSAPDRIAAAQARAAIHDRTLTPAPAEDGPPVYAGLVTRAVALAIDAVIIHAVALTVSGVVALALSVLHGAERFHDELLVVGGVLYVLWSVGYFVALWSFNGQTIGNRIMRIRVVDGRTGRPLGPGRALLRFWALTLAAIPLLAGFLMLLWDDRRRALQDRLVRSVVVHVP